MRQVNDNVIQTQAAATVNSQAIPALNLLYCSAQINATGAAAGTLKFQASNDEPVGYLAQPTHWSDIPGATVAVSASGSFLIPKIELSYQFIRLVYTNTGTGTISVVFKAIGA